MSRTHFINERDGSVHPEKYRKVKKDKKFFGYRYGSGKNPHSKKGEDFINDGYPFETRHRSVIKNKIMEELIKEELKSIN